MQKQKCDNLKKMKEKKKEHENGKREENIKKI